MTTPNKNTTSDYSKEELTKRFEAALRGARLAGPQHKIVTQKRAKKQRSKTKKARI
jgi:hypothetical protein